MEAEQRQHQILFEYDLEHILDRREDYTPTLRDVRNQVKKDTDRLHWTHKRLRNPHNVKVSLSQRVSEQRMKMIEHGLLID
jgi:hypothetical protein